MVKSKALARFALVVLALIAVIGVFSMVNVPVIDTVYAQAGLEDDLGGNNQGNSQENSGGALSGFGNIVDEIKNQDLNENDTGTADWLKGQGGLNGESLATASQALSPVTTIIGYVTGGIVVLTIAGVVLITALDLMYIAIPPIRKLLYKAGTDGTGAYTGGGPAGGYGRMGSMGMSQAVGVGGANASHRGPAQWVSDEAVACAAMLGGSAQSQSGQMASGMTGMGGMAGMSAPQQEHTVRSVIGVYFRKRFFFMILLGVCIIVLTSSTIMNCGVNLAEWVLKIMTVFNNKTAV